VNIIFFVAVVALHAHALKIGIWSMTSIATQSIMHSLEFHKSKVVNFFPALDAEARSAMTRIAIGSQFAQMNIEMTVGTILSSKTLSRFWNFVVCLQMSRVTFLTAQLCMPAVELPVEEFFVIDCLCKFEAFSAVAVLTFIAHLIAVRVLVTGLAIGFVIFGGHVFKNFIHMAGETGDIAMLACQFKLGALVVVELNPREGCRHMTETAFLINLAVVMGISVAAVAIF